MFHYIAAQYLGAFMGAVFVYLTYFEAFQAYKDSGFGTNGFDQNGAGIFATYPQPFLSTGGGFFDQVRIGCNKQRSMMITVNF